MRRPRLVVLDADHARVVGQHGGALRRAGLEELDDAGQAVGDVLTDDTTGVEGPHGQLRARLADGLGGDDADRLAELDHAGRWPATGRSRRRTRPCSDSQVSTERTRTRSTAGVVAERGDDRRRRAWCPPSMHGAVGQRDVLGQHPAVGAGLEVVRAARPRRATTPSIQMPRVDAAVVARGR